MSETPLGWNELTNSWESEDYLDAHKLFTKKDREGVSFGDFKSRDELEVYMQMISAGNYTPPEFGKKIQELQKEISEKIISDILLDLWK